MCLSLSLRLSLLSIKLFKYINKLHIFIFYSQEVFHCRR